MSPVFDPQQPPGAWPGVFDGQLMAADEARLPLHNEGFLLGRAVFTTARWREGNLEFFGAHIERLLRNARAAGLVGEVAAAPAVEDFRGDLQTLSGSLGGRDAALRWTLFPAEFPAEHGLSRWLGVRPLPASPDGGVALVRAAAPLERHPVEALKHTGRLAKHLERERARERGAHDAYQVARDGELLSGTAGCLLWSEGDAVFTPPTHGGLLDSVVRGALLAAGAIDERRLDVAELDVPDELLWANSLHGVLPVHRIEGRTRPLPGAVGPVFRRISARLEGLADAS